MYITIRNIRLNIQKLALELERCEEEGGIPDPILCQLENNLRDLKLFCRDQQDKELKRKK